MRLIFGIIALLIAALIFIYFGPSEFKQKAVNTISDLDFVPETIKDKAADILLTPPQRRERLISDLESHLENLSIAIADPVKKIDAQEIIAKAAKIIEKIKEHNNDPGVIEQFKTLVAEYSKEGCDKKP